MITPENTPAEVIKGDPEAFLSRLQEAERTHVIHLSLAMLSSVRRNHKVDDALLRGLADFEDQLIRVLPERNPQAVRTVNRIGPPEGYGS